MWIVTARGSLARELDYADNPITRACSNMCLRACMFSNGNQQRPLHVKSSSVCCCNLAHCEDRFPEGVRATLSPCTGDEGQTLDLCMAWLYRAGEDIGITVMHFHRAHNGTMCCCCFFSFVCLLVVVFVLFFFYNSPLMIFSVALFHSPTA